MCEECEGWMCEEWRDGCVRSGGMDVGIIM